MTQYERRQFLIAALRAESPYADAVVPSDDEDAQKQLLRALMNVRPPAPLDDTVRRVQDAYLIEAIRERGVTDAASLVPVRGDLYVWRGDITTLQCGAIVNAANSGMTGCYIPGHRCIDNAIHTYAGMQLRLHCAQLMQVQGHAEETGRAKITPAYNLPCTHIIHTVGPIVSGAVTQHDRDMLAQCYRSCCALADEHAVGSIAFCCISTGEFHFPPQAAAEIAVATVERYKRQTGSLLKVIFNVFQESDERIYRNIFR
ncbi:MAG: protein-ADP-ribose hydrolase [Treponema sp.]|nr:protein-ADP-ribose hydrolase [Treponema sp.]